MKVSFFIQEEDLPTLHQYLEGDLEDDVDHGILYLSNKAQGTNDIMVTINYLQYNELLDLDLIKLF